MQPGIMDNKFYGHHRVPYQGGGGGGGGGGRGPVPLKQPRTNLASCVVATLFLTLLVIVCLIVYFSLLKPKDPRISVAAIQLPTFSISNGTVTFTFSQYAAVDNPNRATFSHYDSSLQLLYAGSQLGFMFIPAGEIAAGSTQYMAATFAVKSFPASDSSSSFASASPSIDRLSPAMELESRMMVAGRVRVLHFFSHHVVGAADCRIAVALKDGTVLGFHC